MTELPASPWSPITDLPSDWQQLASPELAGLSAAWNDHRDRLGNSTALMEFNARLRREWAIETGIIENLYSIDRGTTQLLIEHGLNAGLISSGATDKPAELVVSIVTDQQEALEGVFDFVAGRRELTTSFIKQLHQVLTRHQPTVQIADAHGNIVEAKLIRGDWKKLPNNPSRPSGDLAHVYAPPEHTAAEMDRLIAMHSSHVAANVAPEVEAAWLHHRFTQIHPFQDGNGRLARALASMVFIQAGLFPVVIARTERAEYITALESADEGALAALIALLVEQQRLLLFKSMNIVKDVIKSGSRVERILLEAEERLHARQNAKSAGDHLVFTYSKRLEQITLEKLEITAIEITRHISAVDNKNSAKARREQGLLPGAGLWTDIYSQDAAIGYGYFADTGTYTSAVTLQIQTQRRLSFVFAFHSLGSSFGGILAVAPYFVHYVVGDGGLTVPGPMQSSIAVAFTFSAIEPLPELEVRFAAWLDETIALGLDQWRKQL